MRQYLNLLERVINTGEKRKDRTGTGTISLFGTQTRYNLQEGFPLVTTKKVHLKSIIHELIWFLNGDTNTKYLEDNGVTIWKEWSDISGNLRDIYSKQWRRLEYTQKNWETCIYKKKYFEDFDFIPDEKDLIPEFYKFISFQDNCNEEFLNNCGDVFYVLGKIDDGIKRKNYRYAVKFKETGSICDFQLSNINTGEIKDPYKKSILGVACIGRKKIKSENYKRLYSLWLNMIKRCYDKNNPKYPIYGGKNIYVSSEWKCFEKFFESIGNVPFFYTWLINKNYQIDKDYFGTNLYSKDTCIFLEKEENLGLGMKVPVILNDSKLFDSLRSCSNYLNISEKRLSDKLNGLKNNLQHLKIDKYIKEGYVVREKKIIDQISELIKRIKEDPEGRRHILSSWNVAEINQMALPPCHTLFQFYVREGKYLDCQLYQRSADLFLGVPFNIASYAMLIHLVAKVTGYTPGEFIHTIGDAHIYLNHVPQVIEQLKRMPYEKCQFEVVGDISEDLRGLKYENFLISNYQSHAPIKGEVSV